MKNERLYSLVHHTLCVCVYVGHMAWVRACSACLCGRSEANLRCGSLGASAFRLRQGLLLTWDCAAVDGKN